MVEIFECNFLFICNSRFSLGPKRIKKVTQNFNWYKLHFVHWFPNCTPINQRVGENESQFLIGWFSDFGFIFHHALIYLSTVFESVDQIWLEILKFWVTTIFYPCSTFGLFQSIPPYFLIYSSIIIAWDTFDMQWLDNISSSYFKSWKSLRSPPSYPNLPWQGKRRGIRSKNIQLRLVLKVQNCLDPCNIQLFHCKLRHMKKKKEIDKKE